MPRTIEQLQASIKRNDIDATRYRVEAERLRRDEGDTAYAEELEEVAELHSKWAFEDEAELADRELQMAGM